MSSVRPTEPTDPRQIRSEPLNSLLDAILAGATSAAQAAKVFDRVLRELIKPHHQSVFWGDRLLTLDKSVGFRDEISFDAALKQADSSTGANQYASPDGVSWRYHTLIWSARSCLALPGDFVECGVYRGDMTWMITENVDLAGAGKNFYIYDTFSGLDAKYSSKDDFPEAPEFYSFANREYSATDIEEYVRQRFKNKSFVIVTKGVVPDILQKISPDRISFLHVDMNSPGPEIAALEILFDRISPGGIVVFDDYGWKLFRKQKEAADRFMASRGHVILELPTGQGLTVKR